MASVSRLMDCLVAGAVQVWTEGSLEEKVQRLLKTWEMELVHKVLPEDQKTVNSDKYTASTNGEQDARPAGRRRRSF
jgi:hypothetical protein